jgi:prepilin peptidase CpaA
MLTSSASAIWAGAVLSALLGAACVTDARSRRIPNLLVLVIATLGVAYSISAAPWLPGIGRALAGLGLGLAIWFPLYALRMMGAGDVKLFAAAAAWLGPAAALKASFLAALCGGVLSVVWMMYSAGFSLTLLRLVHAARDPQILREKQAVGSRRMPYGIAIAAGVLIMVWHPGLSS